MNQSVKNILIRTGLYHPMQSAYRDLISATHLFRYRRQYRKYAGQGYKCNACDASYLQFVPSIPEKENTAALEKNNVIAGYGQHIICPNCLSTARERLVLAVLNLRQDLGGKRVLHLSPEKHIYKFLKERGAVVITADLLPGFYRTIDGKVQKQDATGLTFDDNYFDLVIANHVMEHIPADEKALQEVFRVVRPGGQAILQVPYSETISSTMEIPSIKDPGMQSALFGQKDHVRIYLLADYIKRLERAGFQVELLPGYMMEQLAQFATQPGEKFMMITKPVNERLQ